MCTVRYYKSTLGDIQVLLNSITELLLKRVPWDLELGVGPLYACLEQLCKPFRLFDLPAELRVNIYENVVPCDVQQKLQSSPWCDGANDYVPRCGGVPALAQASKKLRHEVLPVYFSSTTFCLTGRMDGYKQLVVFWKECYLHNSAKYLRKVDICVPALRDVVVRGTHVRRQQNRQHVAPEVETAACDRTVVAVHANARPQLLLVT